MRISTSWTQQLGVNSMLDQQAKLSKTQMQLSSGLKHLKPSDDPIAAAKILGFKNEIEQTNQYQRNIATARERNNLEESALSSAENIIFRVKELTIQASNATLTQNDRLSIKSEVDELLGEMVGVANSKNANGEYVFSGYLSKTKPFEFDENLNAYDYLGTNDQRSIQIGENRRIADGDSGFDVFQNIDSVSQEATLTGGKRSIFNTLKSLSSALSSNQPNPNAIIKGTKTASELTFTAGSSVTLDSDNATPPVTINLAGSYDSIDDLVDVFNADPALTGAGIKAQSNGRALEFISTTEGASSTISITATSGNFDTATGFSAGDSGASFDLTPTESDPLYYATTNEVLTDLDSALESFIQARTSVGSRLNALDNQEEQHEKFILDFKTTLSEIEDIDYAEAISRFNQQNTALQAAQQSFAKVQNLSLFNYL